MSQRRVTITDAQLKEVENGGVVRLPYPDNSSSIPVMMLKSTPIGAVGIGPCLFLQEWDPKKLRNGESLGTRDYALSLSTPNNRGLCDVL